MSDLHGSCPTPFYEAELFPSTGGFIDGRFCEVTTTTAGNVTCCLPCPVTDWVYSDGFNSRTEIANWINVAAFIASVFLILSFCVLPKKYTHGHYLSICLTVAVGFMELAFIIPLAAKPEQCHNAITPNDMQSSMTCAFSGAFLLFGGWAVIIWVFFRALSLHLQICWEVVPGRVFHTLALIFGWGWPAVGLALALSLTGVSFRFGDVCHINHDHGLADFWGPLLGFAALALIIQTVTMAFCIHVYVKSLFDQSPTTETSSALPSYAGSTRAATARQAYRRVRKIIALQWRGIAIVLIIIALVVFFSVVFVSMDSNLTSATKNDGAELEPWLVCLVLSGGVKDDCLNKVGGFVTNEATIMAVLVCLASAGFFVLILLGRFTMIQGWMELFRKGFKRQNREFVSADARRMSTDHRSYEMLASPGGGYLKVADSTITSPKDVYSPGGTMMNPLAQNAPSNDYFGRDAKRYVSPINSFSTPRPPSSNLANRPWDPTMSYAKNNKF